MVDQIKVYIKKFDLHQVSSSYLSFYQQFLDTLDPKPDNINFDLQTVSILCTDKVQEEQLNHQFSDYLKVLLSEKVDQLIRSVCDWSHQIKLYNAELNQQSDVQMYQFKSNTTTVDAYLNYKKSLVNYQLFLAHLQQVIPSY